jgi:hypothetical protein
MQRLLRKKLTVLTQPIAAIFHYNLLGDLELMQRPVLAAAVSKLS